ncbi:MAG TPA: response regulator [Gemmatimonadaceae bacterium]|nr:response regulator [Gemmatimonadaceae bacterium]
MTRDEAHVLVVEDNALVTSAMRILLEDAKFRVSTAGTVGEAYAACQADPPDVMLLDLRLPDGDGLTLLKRLRADGAPSSVVVALTGRDEPEIRARCLAAGCVDVLLKPVDVRALAPRLRSWLERAGAP